jgi:two-component system, sensor histidine kinase LadS
MVYIATGMNSLYSANMRRIFWLIVQCILFLHVFPAAAQLKLYADGVPCNDSLVNHAFSAFPDLEKVTVQYMNSLDWLPVDPKIRQQGVYQKTIWIRIPVRIAQKAAPINLISIENPHINFLKCWFVQDSVILKESGLNGDHFPFHSRELPNGGFSFALPTTYDPDKMHIIIAADKRETKLKLPIHFSSIAYFSENKITEGINIGILLGFFSIIMLLHLFLLIRTGDTAHVWYIFYIILVSGYLFADKGLLFKYVHPFSPQMNDLIRPTFLTVILFPIIMFYRTLLSLRKNLPIYDRVLLSLVYVFLGLLAAAYATLTDDNYTAHKFWLRLLSILSPCILLIFLWITLQGIRKKIPLSGYAAVSITGLAFFTVLFALEEHDILPDHILVFSHGQYVAMFIDGTVMTIALIARFLALRHRNQELQIQIQNQQEQFLQEMAQWQHREMNRISHFLHDSLGSSLAIIRLENDYMDLNEENRKTLSRKLESVGSDIRSLSHNFSTRMLEEKGLKDTLTEQIRRINIINDKDIQLEWIGDDHLLRFHYQMTVYLIVHELIRNFIRHAQCSKANLQILTAENRVYIYMEDDGVGAIETGNGIGLKNIDDLISLLNGSLKIKTGNGKGFSVSIEFNLIIHGETKHRDS